MRRRWRSSTAVPNGFDCLIFNNEHGPYWTVLRPVPYWPFYGTGRVSTTRGGQYCAAYGTSDFSRKFPKGGTWVSGETVFSREAFLKAPWIKSLMEHRVG